MKGMPVLTLLLASLIALSGCDQDRAMSERGFRLPDGSAVSGRETFLYMHCNQCHTIKGEQVPAIAGFKPFVELGGTLTRVKTYGELVTAIVNPSHKLADGYPENLVSDNGVSKMYVYNGFMTVQELTDLVRFLQEKYEVVPPQFQYRVYP